MTEDAVDRLEHELAVMFRRARALSSIIARQVHPDLEPGAYILLAHLAETGGARLTDLASYVGVGKPTVSRQVKLLQRLGLVERVEAEEGSDRRSATLRLTEEGSSRLSAVRAARRTSFRTLFEEWETEDVETLAALLSRFNDRPLPENWPTRT